LKIAGWQACCERPRNNESGSAKKVNMGVDDFGIYTFGESIGNAAIG